jgi:Domain of unknown function (DU1801)
MRGFTNPAVARVFSDYPPGVRRRLLRLRALIFATTERRADIGPLEETLRWGQPSYVTSETRSGSTIRLDAIRATPGSCAIYFHCQTTLVHTFRKKFGPVFRYEGNRAFIFAPSDRLPRRNYANAFPSRSPIARRNDRGESPSDIPSVQAE